MNLTDEDEESILGMLEGRCHSSPAGLQTNPLNDSFAQSPDVLNFWNASTTGIESSSVLVQTSGIPSKRCTSSENYELQQFGVPKRKRLQRVHSEQIARSNCITDFSTVYDTRREEITTCNKDSQLCTVINKLAKMELEINGLKANNSKFSQKTELEITGLKASNSKISEGLKSLTEQNKALSFRIEQLEINGLCVICKTDKINIWINPCQHWVMCTTCHKKLSETEDVNTGNRLKKCPVCRENINYALPFYGI